MDGKKLLVLSDTHGSVNALRAVLSWAKERMPPNGTICGTVFLGDGISDLRKAADASGFFSEWKLVCGNNDFGYSIPEAAIYENEEHRFFLTHGHHYSLYGGYNSLLAAARNSQADVILFGHTHVPLHRTIDGMQLINPGSIGRPRSRIGATFAVIECIEGGQLKPEFWGLTQAGIRKVTV